MQIFIDSADPEQIRQAYSWGIVDGVTTNPSLAAKNDEPYAEEIRQILEIIDTDSTISLEVTATDVEGMVEQGKRLASIDERVIVKIPCTWPGIKATQLLALEEILVNITLVFNVSQALLAAKAGAFYISPFVGRLNDQETGLGYKTVENIITMLDTQGFASQLLYASVRGIDYVEHAAEIGADIATVPFQVLEKLVHHNKTDEGLAKFLKDWEDANLQLPV